MWRKFFRAVRRKEYTLSALFWTTVAAVVVYTVWPLDIIHDYVPVVGLADDLGLWGVVSLLLAREKKRWESTLTKGAVDVVWRDKPSS